MFVVMSSSLLSHRIILLLLIISGVSSYDQIPLPSARRQLLVRQGTVSFLAVCCSGLAVMAPPEAAATIDELPSFIRPYTNLAPLGSPDSTSKTTGLSLDALKDRLEHDLVFGSENNGGYFITGDLSTDIFRDDCIFTDPTNQVASLTQYQKGVRLLFDSKTSVVELIEPLVIDTGRRTLTGRIRSRGMLKLPWHPYISAYESKIVYTIDTTGLVAAQDQQWSKAADTALQETFTPTIFTPPPSSKIPKPDDEPVLVTNLFNKVNGRRPNEYSLEERREIATLIDKICDSQTPLSKDLENSLSGTWMLSYLQPGPDGSGIDRRIPFPEFDFNDSFQTFTDTTLENVGQVVGPLVEVHVSGSLRRNDENKKSTNRFIANIDHGELCLASSCVPLPISGKGLFESSYVGKRLRIGQNLNGGGARVVQVRMQ